MKNTEILCQLPCLAVRLPRLSAAPAESLALKLPPVCPAAGLDGPFDAALLCQCSTETELLGMAQ